MREENSQIKEREKPTLDKWRQAAKLSFLIHLSGSFMTVTHEAQRKLRDGARDQDASSLRESS